jgi:hypothetical protein
MTMPFQFGQYQQHLFPGLSSPKYSGAGLKNSLKLKANRKAIAIEINSKGGYLRAAVGRRPTAWA